MPGRNPVNAALFFALFSFPFFFLFYLGTRQSALWRVVASSSKSDAMSFPCGTETKVYIIFSPAWRFFFEAGRSPSLCWLGTRVICLHQGPLEILQLPCRQVIHLNWNFFFFYLLARIYHDWLWSNTKDALCPMGSQAVIRTTAGHELQRHCSTGYALFDTYNFKKPAVAADPLTPSRCNYTVLVWKGPQFKEEN